MPQPRPARAARLVAPGRHPLCPQRLPVPCRRARSTCPALLRGLQLSLFLARAALARLPSRSLAAAAALAAATPSLRILPLRPTCHLAQVCWWSTPGCAAFVKSRRRRGPRLPSPSPPLPCPDLYIYISPPRALPPALPPSLLLLLLRFSSSLRFPLRVSIGHYLTSGEPPHRRARISEAPIGSSNVSKFFFFSFRAGGGGRGRGGGEAAGGVGVFLRRSFPPLLNGATPGSGLWMALWRGSAPGESRSLGLHAAPGSPWLWGGPRRPLRPDTGPGGRL